MGELFETIRMQKKKKEYITPKAFVQKLQIQNEMFSGPMHQVCCFRCIGFII